MMTFDITPDNGQPYRLTAGSRDVLSWEKAGKGRSFRQLGQETTMAGLYGLAYFAARRQGHFGGSLAEWEESVELMPVRDDDEPDDEEAGEGVDPTQPAPTPDSSSPSPSPQASRPASGRRKAQPQ